MTDAEESKRAYLKFLSDRGKITEATTNIRSTIRDMEVSVKNLRVNEYVKRLTRLAIKKISDMLDSVLESRKNKGQTP